MCWAAAASNVLAWSGWADRSGGDFADEDSVFSYFQAHWTDEGGFAAVAFGWWIDGSDDYSLSVWEKLADTGRASVDVAGGGGFFKSAEVEDVAVVWNDSTDSTAIDFVISYLNAGYGITLSITLDSGGNHEITCWGYEIAADGSIYLYYSDSDDGKFAAGTAADVLNVSRISLVNGNYFLDDFTANISTRWAMDGYSPGFTSAYIYRATALRQYDSELSGDRCETFGASRILEFEGDTAVRRGNIDCSGDDDFYVFTAMETGSVTICVDPLKSSTSLDYLFSVYDARFNCLVDRITGNSFYEAIGTIAGETYYIMVSDGGNYENGLAVEDYTYTVTVHPPIIAFFMFPALLRFGSSWPSKPAFGRGDGFSLILSRYDNQKFPREKLRCP